MSTRTSSDCEVRIWWKSEPPLLKGSIKTLIFGGWPPARLFRGPFHDSSRFESKMAA
jgi:hypothetical protein